MVRSTAFRFGLMIACLTTWIADARAQCFDWRAFPQTGAEGINTIEALQRFDDGTGLALYVAGAFQPQGGGTPTQKLQRWNGSQFSTVPGYVSGRVYALLAYDDGTGPSLLVGGDNLVVAGVPTTGLVRWNGTTWSAVGGGVTGTVISLAGYDDGTGMALYAGGLFTPPGSATSSRLWRWDGTNWTNIAAGSTLLQSLAVTYIVGFDDGTGPAIYVGSSTGSTQNFLRYQGGTWTNLTASNTFSVRHLIVGDLGSGPQLFGSFNSIDPAFTGVRTWVGGQLQLVGAQGNTVYGTMRVADTGGGPKLYVSRENPSSTNPVLQVFDGANWTSYANTIVPGCGANYYSSGAKVLEVFDSGNGLRLVGGSVVTGTEGLSGSRLAEWAGSGWNQLGAFRKGLSDDVFALHVFDDGSGPALFAGGDFCYADSTVVQGLARWNGFQWSSVGPLANGGWGIRALTTHATISGPKLAYGTAYGVVQVLNGSAYTAEVSPGYAGTVFALQSFGGDLYAGGVFTYFGSVPSPNIARLTPSGPAAVGSGALAGVNGAINALLVFDAGSGTALYAGGSFTSGNGVSMNRIGRWNGSQWAPLGLGLNNLCDALAEFDDGSGRALYAAGTFTTAGGVAASCVARWKNNTWSPLGAGLNAQVLSLGVYDDGSGPALYAGGNFTASGSTPIARVAKWNGTSWMALGSGTDGTVWALKSFDDGSGSGPQLFAGGTFGHVANLESARIASWRGCDGPITRFCFGDGSIAPCPCGNQGLPARGCDNSFATGGVRMNATGRTNPDTLAFYLAGLIPGTATLLFQGDAALTGALPFGDGLLCVGGNLLRMKIAFATGGTLGFPLAGDPSISSTSASLGDPLSAGFVREYQAWYRDANTSFCAPATSNLSNAVRVEW